jgi:hypothetical protein
LAFSVGFSHAVSTIGLVADSHELQSKRVEIEMRWRTLS